MHIEWLSCRSKVLSLKDLSGRFPPITLVCFFLQIVEAVYDPVPEGVYSEKVTDTISR